MSLSHFPRLTLSPVLTLLKMPTIEHSEHSISPLTTTTLFTVLPTESSKFRACPEVAFSNDATRPHSENLSLSDCQFLFSYWTLRCVSPVSDCVYTGISIKNFSSTPSRKEFRLRIDLYLDFTCFCIIAGFCLSLPTPYFLLISSCSLFFQGN